MQLVEEGKISLDDPAKTDVPEIAQIQVLDAFDDHGDPKMRAPKCDMTVGQRLLHTAGFGYDFFNNDLIKYGEKKHAPSVATSSMASLCSALLFDPGERSEYGSTIDWAGFELKQGQRPRKAGDRRHDDGCTRFRIAARSRATHGRARTLLDGRRLSQIHPQDPMRRLTTQR